MSDEKPEKKRWFHVDDPASVGRRLREARQQAGLSQRELAFPGCTAVYICRIEKGDRVPSLQVLRELARRTGVTEGWLAKSTESTSPVEIEELLADLGPAQMLFVCGMAALPAEKQLLLLQLSQASIKQLLAFQAMLETSESATSG